jgi:hypothetical protein
MESVPVPHGVHDAAHNHLRFGVPAPDRCHVAMALLWCVNISYQLTKLLLSLLKNDSIVSIPIG